MIEASFARMRTGAAEETSAVKNRQTLPMRQLRAVALPLLPAMGDFPNAAGAQTSSSFSKKQWSQGLALTWRHAVKFSYAKLLFGCAAVAFASPIDVQKPLRRAVSGHLVMLSVPQEAIVQRLPDQPLEQTGLVVPLN